MFFSKENYWCGKCGNCLGRLLWVGLNLGLKMEGIEKTMWVKTSSSNLLWQSREPWGNGQKEKEKPNDSSGGCQLQRMSGGTFIIVEDAASTQGLKGLRYYSDLWPFQLNPNRKSCSLSNFSRWIFLGLTLAALTLELTMYARSVPQNWEQVVVIGRLSLIRSFISKSHQNKWLVWACWLPLATLTLAITKADVNGSKFLEVLLNHFIPCLLQSRPAVNVLVGD